MASGLCQISKEVLDSIIFSCMKLKNIETNAYHSRLGLFHRLSKIAQNIKGDDAFSYLFCYLIKDSFTFTLINLAL